jgi:hypothetical protein
MTEAGVVNVPSSTEESDAESEAAAEAAAAGCRRWKVNSSLQGCTGRCLSRTDSHQSGDAAGFTVDL